MKKILLISVVFVASSMVFAESNCSNPNLNDFEKHLCLGKMYEKQDEKLKEEIKQPTNKITIKAKYSSGGNGSY